MSRTSCFFLLVLVSTVLGCGQDPVNSGPCRCTSDANVNGENVQFVGCARHVGDSCFCYVANPERCPNNEFNREWEGVTIQQDTSFSNMIRFRECGQGVQRSR